MVDSRARSFGSVAEQYDQFRPAPPIELAAEFGVLDGRDVLEIAAGTGLVTRFLQSRGARMTIVEPDDEMRAVLERQSPAVTSYQGSAEALPLAEASFDWVVTSSAWHWFRQPDARHEIARVLRDGGRLMVLSNGFDQSHEWLEDLAALRGPGSQSWSARRAHEAANDLDGEFIDVELLSVDWTWPRSHEQLMRLFGTFSAMITRPPAERRQMEVRLRDELQRLAPSGSLAVPMALRGVRATRRPR